MRNSPYLDQPIVPLAVTLRSMLAETEVKIFTAPKAERERLRRRAKVLQELLTPSSATPLPTFPTVPSDRPAAS